ncbi:MAG: glycosyltransferase family 2 protein [Deltaproteobacteria bacterium]|nr:glycosyltransferase family 2 protein [Deltaproteobacteria bacterium]
MPALISIIIRTHNEERWIHHCLESVFSQKFKDFEVILVDNESTDQTLTRVRQFSNVRIVQCKEYLPGKALNIGIQESKSQFIVCLSGHCIPGHNEWLFNLLQNFDDPLIAGVYGRQQPLSFSSDSDKRDLTIAFGLDKKIQIKDSFFHNANSMIRRSVWKRFPFDEQLSNIEDRAWAQKILQHEFKICYEPLASVYHHHGIHHNGNEARCAKVVKILEELNLCKGHMIEIDKLKILAIIPIRGDILHYKEKPLFSYTIEQALTSEYIQKVIVSTDNPEIAQIAKSLGAQVPFLRDSELSKEFVDVSQVFQFTLEQLEKQNYFSDLIVTMEPTFPFRTENLIDRMIEKTIEEGLDTVVAAKCENKTLWKVSNAKAIQLTDGLTPRKLKDPTYLELRGVGCVTHPMFVRSGQLFGNNTGLYEVTDPLAPIEIRCNDDMNKFTDIHFFK